MFLTASKVQLKFVFLYIFSVYQKNYIQDLFPAAFIFSPKFLI